ncbi:hypothetical protein DV738_g293, partial [Chaetothyriales sp. CBS 135597]
MEGMIPSKKRRRETILPDSPESSVKRRKRTVESAKSRDYRTPEFYDSLSKAHLTRGGLRELKRRILEARAAEDPSSLPPLSSIAAADAADTEDRPDLKQFARQGGPNLSHLRGFASSANRNGSMSQSSRKRSASRRSDSGSKSKTSRSSYDPEFEQNMIDGGIYPHSRASKPANLKELRERAAEDRPSLSPSKFNDEDFEEFVTLCDTAGDEASARANVISVIEGRGRSGHFYAGDRRFNHLAPMADKLPDAKPDLYYGARPESINRQVRRDLGKQIVPANNTSLPAAPNFFLEAKSEGGRADVAKRQACHDGAIGARTIHSLKNYKASEPQYDGNAESFSSTYHGGTATMGLYAHHTTAPRYPGEPPEYHMAQIGSYAMTHNRNAFAQGAGAYRNLRDLAKSKRDDAIEHANEIARRAPTYTPSTLTRSSRMSQSPIEDEPSDTSTDELTADFTSSKRARRGHDTPGARSSQPAGRSRDESPISRRERPSTQHMQSFESRRGRGRDMYRDDTPTPMIMGFRQAAVFLTVFTGIATVVANGSDQRDHDLAPPFLNFASGTSGRDRVSISFDSPCDGCFAGSTDAAALKLTLDVDRAEAECSGAGVRLNGIDLASSSPPELVHFPATALGGRGHCGYLAEWYLTCLDDQASLLRVLFSLQDDPDRSVVGGFAASFQQTRHPWVIKLDPTFSTFEQDGVEYYADWKDPDPEQSLRVEVANDVMSIWKAEFDECSSLSCYLQTAFKNVPVLFKLVVHGLKQESSVPNVINNTEDQVRFDDQDDQLRGSTTALSEPVITPAPKVAWDLPVSSPLPRTTSTSPSNPAVSSQPEEEASSNPAKQPVDLPFDANKLSSLGSGAPPGTDIGDSPPSGEGRPPSETGARPWGNGSPPRARPHPQGPEAGSPPSFSPGSLFQDILEASKHLHIHLFAAIVSFFVVTVTGTGLFIAIRYRQCLWRDPRRRAECLARREEWKRRKAYKKAACKHRVRTFLAQLVWWKRADLSDAENEELMRNKARNEGSAFDQEINGLRLASEIVQELVRSEESRGHTSGSHRSQRTSISETLPTYSEPPGYSSAAEGEISVIDGFTGYTPSGTASSLMRTWKWPTALGSSVGTAAYTRHVRLRSLVRHQPLEWLKTAVPSSPASTSASSPSSRPLSKALNASASRQQTVEELEKRFFRLANTRPGSRQIDEIFKELTTARGITPTSAHYEALILRNCDPRHGSVSKVKEVLAAMQSRGVAITASTYQAALTVLAVHPSPELQQHILSAMTAQWMAISADAEHAIIASLIRDGQLELGQARLAALLAKRKKKQQHLHQLQLQLQPQPPGSQPAPPAWLFVLLAHALCAAADFPALLQLAYDLHDHGGGGGGGGLDLPRSTWAHLLAEAVRHRAFDLTLHLWLHHVEPMYITPSYAVCTGALDLAATHASPKLAESAMLVLEAVHRPALDALRPSDRQHLDDLVAAAYKERNNPQRYRSGNMFALFNRAKGHENAFFDPKLALTQPQSLLPKKNKKGGSKNRSSKR